MKREERDEIVKRLLDIAEDRKTFFKDDGDDEVFREDYAALVRAAQLLDDLDAETARADRAEEAGYYAACMKAISDVACKLANVMADRDRLSEQAEHYEEIAHSFCLYRNDCQGYECCSFELDEKRFTEGSDSDE